MTRKHEYTELAGLERLFREEYGRIVIALTAQLYDRAAAEECAQDAFVEALRHWKTLASYDDPKSWLWLVALRRGNKVRTRRRRGEPALASRAPAPEWDALIDLYDAVRRLPERQREVVTLYYFADLSVSAIASELGIAEGTVKSQLHDARHTLREGHRERSGT